MLHIINNTQALKDCLPFLSVNDAILLIEDGVYAATQNISLTQPVFALKSDISNRGISDKINPVIQLADYNDFVELTLRFHPSQTW